MNPEPAQRTKEPQLLPCPFCGGTHLEVIFYNTPCVVCHDCYANGAQAERLRVDVDNRPEAAEQARKLWNRRAGIPDPAGAIEKARAALAIANSLLQSFEMHVAGRLPRDTSDSVSMEAIHAYRLCQLLQTIQPALAALTAETQEEGA